MRHLLPVLPYGYDALEPHIDARTMILHHDHHHAAYVSNLNAAMGKLPALQHRSASWLLRNLSRIPRSVRTRIRNNAGGHVNHCLLWQAMSPEGGGEPKGLLADALTRDFGSFAQFKARFITAGTQLFGSGWVWLVRSQLDGGKLVVLTTAGHVSPIMQGHFPILVNDVWEHAHYLKYENRRSDYLDAWWSVTNWRMAERRFERSDHTAEQDWEDEGGKVIPPAAVDGYETEPA